MASEDLLKKAVAAFNALSPEQQQQMMEEQRQSWARGNVGLSRDEGRMTSPIKPTPTTTGKCGELETVARQYRWSGNHKWKPFGPIFDDERTETRELVTRSQAEELLVAQDANYAGLVQQTINQQVQINALEADNAALTAKLETANALVTCCCGNPVDSHGIGDGHSPVDQYHYAMMQLEEQNAEKDAEISAIAGHLDCEPDSDSILHTVREIEADKAIYKERAEALEAKLAAAVETHKSLFGDKTMEDILWPDVKPTDLITIRVQKQIYDKARAVLGGKPS